MTLGKSVTSHCLSFLIHWDDDIIVLTEGLLISMLTELYTQIPVLCIGKASFFDCMLLTFVSFSILEL